MLYLIFGVLAGWFFRSAYIPIQQAMYKKLYRNGVKQNKELQKENQDLRFRLKVFKTYVKGYTGLPYAE